MAVVDGQELRNQTRRMKEYAAQSARSAGDAGGQHHGQWRPRPLGRLTAAEAGASC
ncbi:MAG: hypothetical protein R2838_21180 [Caldilineaceae bacterium]